MAKKKDTRAISYVNLVEGDRLYGPTYEVTVDSTSPLLLALLVRNGEHRGVPHAPSGIRYRVTFPSAPEGGGGAAAIMVTNVDYDVESLKVFLH